MLKEQSFDNNKNSTLSFCVMLMYQQSLLELIRFFSIKNSIDHCLDSSSDTVNIDLLNINRKSVFQ